MDRRRHQQQPDDDLTPPKEFKLFQECLQGDAKHYDCPKESTTHKCACPMHPFDNTEGSGEEAEREIAGLPVEDWIDEDEPVEENS